jgi:hypothetical protein
VGCSTSGTSNTDKSLNDIEYEDFLNDYTESVQIHTKTLESLSEGIEIMTEDNFQSFEKDYLPPTLSQNNMEK